MVKTIDRFLGEIGSKIWIRKHKGELVAIRYENEKDKSRASPLWVLGVFRGIGGENPQGKMITIGEAYESETRQRELIEKVRETGLSDYLKMCGKQIRGEPVKFVYDRVSGAMGLPGTVCRSYFLKTITDSCALQ